MIVVGGMGSIWGPLVGAVVLMVADEGFKEFQDWRALGMGLILPLFVVLLPGGLVGLFRPRRSKVPAGVEERPTGLSHAKAGNPEA
jgi:branched-chain amino acid transport system permease protein